MSTQIQRSFSSINNPEVFDKISSEIQAHIKKNGLTENIKGKTYPVVEAWQYAGALLGVFAQLEDLERMECADREFKYKATIILVDTNSGKTVGRGAAVCSNKENSKKYFDEYAISSMAQTRATGKAFRLAMGWILKASGYEPTAAEEMDEMDASKGQKQPSDSQIKREYRDFVLKAFENCATAKGVHDLIQLASAFKEDADLIDAARVKYIEIRDGITG